MTDLKLEDLYYVCFHDVYSNMKYNADYETIYHGINNARKAAIDYDSKFTAHLHCPEIGDRAVIYNVKLNDNGSISIMETDLVESYETVNIEYNEYDNEVYTYSVVDNHGNKEIKIRINI